MAKIAILIPSFNSANSIGLTLESVQAQGTGLRRIFVIYLADDCSKDHTIAIAEASRKAAVPLHVYKAERNLGERGNVNRVMELAEREGVD